MRTRSTFGEIPIGTQFRLLDNDHAPLREKVDDYQDRRIDHMRLMDSPSPTPYDAMVFVESPGEDIIP